MKRNHFEVGETAVTILSEPGFLVVARGSIFETREVIQRQIDRDPFFRDTLEPYHPRGEVDPIIQRMCDASARAGVGPMATVAGIVAEEAVRAMVAEGARNAVVDNGGDIAMFLNEGIVVGLHTGTSLSDVGFECLPRDSVYGVCTSSGTVGPSISFGRADAATIIAEDVVLADACATRLGNMISDDDEGTISSALDAVSSIEGVEGALVVAGGNVAMKGRLPGLVRMGEMEDRVARRMFTIG